MGSKDYIRIIKLFFVFSMLALFIGCGGGSSSGSSAGSSSSGSSDGSSDDGSSTGDDSGGESNVILELKALKSHIILSNINITNLDCLSITNKVTDTNSTSARALASYLFVDLQTESQVTSRGSVSDVSSNGRLSSSSSLQYENNVSSIFMGSNYSLSAEVSSKGYGYTHALASMSEMIYFTALKACDITFSFDYSGTDDGFNPGLDSYNYSYAGINYQIANFNDALSEGLAVNVLDAEKISPGTLTTTMHFDAGESGWITLGASAGVSLYRPDPDLEEDSSDQGFWY